MYFNILIIVDKLLFKSFFRNKGFHNSLDYPNVYLDKPGDYYKFIEELIGFGLDGLEIYFYSNDRHSKEIEIKLNNHVDKLIKKPNLLKTYGSDCHGPKNSNKDKIFLRKFGSNKIIDFKNS